MTSQRRRIADEGDTVKVRNTGKRERSELADLDRSARSVVAENIVPGAEVLHTSMDGDGRTSNAAPLVNDQETAADQTTDNPMDVKTEPASPSLADVHRAEDARDRAIRKKARIWLLRHYHKNWRGFRHAQGQLCCMTPKVAHCLTTWHAEDWNKFQQVSFKAWQSAGGTIAAPSPSYNLENVGYCLLRRMTPGLRVSHKQEISDGMITLAATLTDRPLEIDFDSLTEMWHGTTLPFFFRIFHSDHKQLFPGCSKPTGIYLWELARKEKAWGYASAFPLLKGVWIRTIVQVAAHGAKKIRVDQMIAQTAYMTGAEIRIQTSKTIYNSDWVVGIDAENNIFDIGAGWLVNE